MTNPTVAEAIERARYLLSLDKVSNGGPYKGYAAQTFLETIRNSVSHLERLQAENDRLRARLTDLIDACDRGRRFETGAGGMSVEAQLRRTVINGVSAMAVELARDALAQEEGR